MIEPVEKLLQQMSRQSPSPELDKAIIDLLERRSSPPAPAAKTYSPKDAVLWLATSVACLLVGIAIGRALEVERAVASTEGSSRAERADAVDQRAGVAKPTPRGLAGATDAAAPNAWAAGPERPAARTRILGEQLLRTEDGAVLKRYRVLTPRRRLVYDANSQAYYDVDVPVEGSLFTMPAGI